MIIVDKQGASEFDKLPKNKLPLQQQLQLGNYRVNYVLTAASGSIVFSVAGAGAAVVFCLMYAVIKCLLPQQ